MIQQYASKTMFFYTFLFLVFIASAASCPGETAPGCICDEYPCDDGMDKCCNDHGNYQCVPLWQDCPRRSSDDQKDSKPRSSCPGETAPGCICDEYPCDDGMDKCCNDHGNYQCVPLWQDCPRR